MATPLEFGGLKVYVHADQAAASDASASDAIATINGAIGERGTARVVFACAPSQTAMLEALMNAPIDWSCVTAFHMDEYLGIPADDPSSFRCYLEKHVVGRVRMAAVHEIAGETPDPAAECARYAALLGQLPVDLVLCGIGENGHLAFNDPPYANFADTDTVKIVELDEACRRQQVNDGTFKTYEDVPHRALTMTIPALLRAKKMIGTVLGTRKARAVRDTLHGMISTACPASALRAHGAAVLHIDRDAASLSGLAHNAG